MKQEIRTDKAPRPVAPYSQGLIVGSRVYVAGQRPVDAATGEVVEGFQNQVRQTLTNVRHVLEAGGCTMDDVVKITVYLADISRFADLNEVYTTFFNPPYPVRTTVAASLRGIEVEIDAIAEKS